MAAPSNAKRWRRVVAGLAVAGFAAGAGAFTFIQNPNTGLPVKWPSGPVRVTIKLGSSQTNSDGLTFNGSAASATEIWNAQLGSAQLTATQVPAGSAGDGNGLNEMAFSSSVFGQAFGENVLAVTTGGWRRGNESGERDILFNTDFTWDSYRGSRRTPVDLRRVAIHELGHLLGLDHPDEANPTQAVAAIMNSRIGNLDTLVDDDIQGGQSLYGPPGVPANDNFASATVITNNNGLVTIKSYNTNATRETGEPRHANTSGGRSVWFRWTAPIAGTVTLDTGKAASGRTDLRNGVSSYYDTILAVYTGSTLSALTSVASDDDIEDGVIQVSTVSFAVTANTTYQIAVDGYNPDDGSGADSGGITLNLLYTPVSGPPVILTQPVGVTADVGGTASLSVSAAGSGTLTYQWFFKDVAIAGATSSTYSVTNVQAANDGLYKVTITNDSGSVTSNSVLISVRTPTPPPPSGGSGGGGGGGGGAPSPGFLALLTVLAGLRLYGRARR